MTRRILLIEDEQLSQDIITSLLRGQGYSVDVAIDGFAALERARSQRYDAALIDYHLPEMDGYTLGRLLREQHPGGEPGPVLIGLTADSNGLAAPARFGRGVPRDPAQADPPCRAVLDDRTPVRGGQRSRRCCVQRGFRADRDAGAHGPAGKTGARAAAALWRSHGLASPPRALASPPPTIEQAAALTVCFDLVEPDQAQCILLLERHGINEALRATRRAGRAPLPIIGLSVDHADICDRLFRVDDPSSWKELSVALGAEATATVVALPTPTPATAAGNADFSLPRAEPQAVHQPIHRPGSGRGGLPVLPVGPDLSQDLRALLVAGILTPLEALRSDLAADAPAQAARLETLDAILLSTGTIADALNPQAAKATDDARFDPAELAGSALAMIRDSRPAGSVALALPSFRCLARPPRR